MMKNWGGEGRADRDEQARPDYRPDAPAAGKLCSAAWILDPLI